MRIKNIFLITAVCFFILALGLDLSAQEGRGKGRVRGTVTDEAGNPLKDVKITAQHLQYNTMFESKSDKNGNWAVAGLGTGYFRFVASMEGYGETYHEMRVSQFARNNPQVNFTLRKIQAAPLDVPAVEDESTLALFEEGNRLFDEEKYAEAVVKLEEFLAANPTIYQVNLNIGNCYKEMGEYEKAISSFNTLLEKAKEETDTAGANEASARALAGIGETYIKQGDLTKAGEYLRQAIELFPEDETLAFNVGEIYFDQGETDKAIEYFKMSAQMKDDWGPPHRQLGYAYLNKGEFQLAVDSFKKYLKVDPESPQAAVIEGLIPKIEEMIKK
jgi:tetratricopeptide (TPR) repeat protein